MKILKHFLLLSLILFISCGPEEKQVDNKTKVPETASSSAATNKKYKIKSGIITSEIENSMIGGKINSTLYFDDFGSKECSEDMYEMEMMGQKIKTHNIRITSGDYMYNIDMEKKAGTKMKIYSNANPYDFSSISEEMKKDWNLKNEGTESILGKTCEVFSMNNEKSKLKGTVYNWQGLTLKSEIEMGGIKMKTAATKIEENIPIPSEKFEVPKDIKIQ
ncbi:MAG: hypothetical protein ACM339_12835 [Ignavibacteria bacterium]